MSRCVALIRSCKGRGGGNAAADADALADLWGAVEAEASANTGEADDEVGGFGFGGVLDAKVEALENAVKLRKKLRRHSALVAVQDLEAEMVSAAPQGAAPQGAAPQGDASQGAAPRKGGGVFFV